MTALAITHSVVIDGTSQPGFAGTPLISIYGGSLGGGVFNGLSIAANNCTVEGLAIGYFQGGNGLDVVGSSNIIGGTTTAARNLLVEGIRVGGSGNLVQGNYLGADVTGKIVLAGARNTFGASDEAHNTIGGTTPAAGNLIYSEAGYGAAMSAAPVLTSAVSSNGVITISGTLTRGLNLTYTLNFFGDAAGTALIGSGSVRTDGYGKATFTVTSAGQTITATSADAFYNTSLLSAGLAIGPTLVVTGFPSTTTAGAAGAFTVTIRNIDGSTLTSYTGTAHFSSSDPHAVLPADYTFTAADQGTHTFSAALQTAGLQSLIVANAVTPGVVGGAESILVNPAAAASFALYGPSSTAAKTTFTFTIAAVDAYGNIATSYTGTVYFSSSDPRAILPSGYTFTAADKGVHTFTKLALRKIGEQTITVTDALFSFTDSFTMDVT